MGVPNPSRFSPMIALLLRFVLFYPLRRSLPPRLCIRFPFICAQLCVLVLFRLFVSTLPRAA